MTSAERSHIQTQNLDEKNNFESPLLKEKEPEDRHNIAYYMVLLFGLATLLPWNAVLTSLDFFDSKMHEYKPASVFGFAVNGLLIFTSIGNMIYGQKYSFNLRISGGQLATAVLMIALPLITNALESGAAFAACISILVIFGIFGGIVQSTTFALGGMLPPKYMGAIMLGQGLSGIAINVLRAICLLSIPDNKFLGALIYFIIAACILVLCAILHIKFQTMPFVKYYIKKANDEKHKTKRRLTGDAEGLLGSVAGMEVNKTDVSRASNVTKENNYLSTPSNLVPEEKQNLVHEEQVHSQLVAFLIMMKKAATLAWRHLLALAMTFFITFTIFPAIITDEKLEFMQGMTNIDLRIGWTMLIYIFLFNMFDTVGRWLGGQSFGMISDKTLFILSYSRVIFIATSFLLDYSVSPQWLFGPTADWFKLVNMILFAFTNGYCSTLCAIKSPSRAPEDSKEVVGTFVGVFITTGIVLGSLLALALSPLVKGNEK